MTSIVQIGDHEITLTANAATCYRYKQLFKRDLFQLFKSASEDMGMDVVQELAYVMMMQASKAVDSMSIDNYMTWLEDFDPLDFAHSSGQIVNVYAGQPATTSTAKKKSKPTERELNTPLFVLRCLQIGLRIPDLDLIDEGMVYDMMVESGNDSAHYDTVATQEDMNRF